MVIPKSFAYAQTISDSFLYDYYYQPLSLEVKFDASKNEEDC